MAKTEAKWHLSMIERNTYISPACDLKLIKLWMKQMVADIMQKWQREYVHSHHQREHRNVDSPQWLQSVQIQWVKWPLHAEERADHQYLPIANRVPHKNQIWKRKKNEWESKVTMDIMDSFTLYILQTPSRRLDDIWGCMYGEMNLTLRTWVGFHCLVTTTTSEPAASTE